MVSRVLIWFPIRRDLDLIGQNKVGPVFGSTICSDHLEFDDCADQKDWGTFSGVERWREFLSADRRNLPIARYLIPAGRLAHSVHVQEFVAAK